MAILIVFKPPSLPPSQSCHTNFVTAAEEDDPDENGCVLVYVAAAQVRNKLLKMTQRLVTVGGVGYDLLGGGEG